MATRNNDILLKRSLEAIRVLEEKLKKHERGEREPVAIIGMSCRFPGGAGSTEAFWDLLMSGKDGVSVVPEERWDEKEFYDPDPEAKGKSYTNKAGFIEENIKMFDARFFGISPREATELDPQHRLLLEVSWEAMEKAGVLSDKLKGSKTGVFIGIGGSEFSSLTKNADSIGIYTGTGMAVNIAAGRIAHAYGFHGPTMSIDTACSSSLVSAHLAMHSLQTRESDMALAGGVNILLAPELFVMLSKMNALSKDGKCKTFDADADGYVRAEGCGIVVLKRLSDALADGDPVLAVIKGSAVNHDGQTSGLTVPNGLAQQKLIQAALDNAQVSADDVSFIETHGTGTKLGDPIEIQALSHVFERRKNRKQPLLIGAVKSNIGHLEAAAGIAGLIKTVLCVQHGMVPPDLHFDTLNERIRLDTIPAVIPTEAVTIRQGDTPVIAGVSSFGFSGTNAHLILAEAPKKEKKEKTVERPVHVLAVSAKDENALKELLQLYKAYLATDTSISLQDFCYTANTGRLHFPYRQSFVAATNEEMCEKLEHGSSENISQARYQASETDGVNNYAFFINGSLQGIKDAGKILYETQPLFRYELESCSSLCQSITSVNPLQYIYSESTEKNQGAEELSLFCLHYSLCVLLERWGIMPMAIFGDGAGEFVAACMAGIMGMETAIKIIARNNELLPDFDFEKDLSSPRVRFISTFTGEPALREEVLNPSYWMQRTTSDQVLQKSIESLVDQNYRQFVELSLGASALSPVAGDVPGIETCTMLRVSLDNPWDSILKLLGEMYQKGADINWTAFDKDYIREKLVLPTYPFQRKHYWPKIDRTQQEAAGVNFTTVRKIGESYNPLEPKRTLSPLKEQQFEYFLSEDIFPEIKDNENVMHVGYYQELLGGIMRYLHGKSAYVVRDMEWVQALYFNSKTPRNVTLVLGEENEQKEQKFMLYSRGEDQEEWMEHAGGYIKYNRVTPTRRMQKKEMAQIKERCTQQCDAAEFDMMMETQGFDLGPSGKWVDFAWYNNREVLARFRKQTDHEKNKYYAIGLHPGIYDACAQLFLLGGNEFLKKDDLYMIIRIEEFFFNNMQQDEELWCHMKVSDSLTEEGYMQGEYYLFDKDGNHVAQVKQQAKILSKDLQLALKSAIQEKAAHSAEEDIELTERLKNIPGEEQQLIVQEFLTEQIAALLGMTGEEVGPQTSIRDLGLDSMVGVELKNIIDSKLSIDLALEYILQGPTIVQFARTVLRIFNGKIEESNEVGWYSNTNYSMELNDWGIHYVKKPNAKVRLYCIPYGVIGGSLFREWSKKLPDFIEVWPIQFPGKENRMNEKPVNNIVEIVDTLEKVFSPALDLPYALYGHSIGSLMAFRLAYRLWQNHENKPVHLFPGGYVSPSIYPNPVYAKGMRGLKHFGYDGFPEFDMIANVPPEKWKEYHEFIGLEFGINMTEELRRVIKPVAFSEFKICHSYEPDPDEPLFNVPITGFHGEKDTFCSEEEMAAWKNLTTGPFKYHVLPGDHFFCHEDQDLDELLRLIAEELEKYAFTKI